MNRAPIAAAVSVAPALAAGIEHLRAGRPDAAAESYRAALEADPGNPEALHHLGLIACRHGRPDEGAKLFRQALARDPGNAGLHNNLALALTELGRHAEAVAECDRAIALRPGYAAAFSNRGMALRALGRAADAAASLRQATALQPNLAEAHMNLGLALLDRGQDAEALACQDRALALRPDYVEALCNRGAALLALDRPAEALASLDRAAALRPDLAELHRNRGNALRLLRRRVEALASYRRALDLRPDDPEALANLGLVLVEDGQPEAALASLERALALAPTLAEAHASRGSALRDLGRMEEAREGYARALALAPENSRFALYLATTCLRLGRLIEGWRHYERRWEGRTFYVRPGRFADPPWRGEPLTGRTLFVHADQGFGDAIQFCRCLPLLAARGLTGRSRVVFEVPRTLLPLLAALPGVSQAIAAGDPLPEFDAHCALLDLPGILGIDLASIPPPPPLPVDPARARAWAARMPDDGRLRVGLAWSGSRDHLEDAARTIPLAMLRPLAGLGAAFYVIHQDVRETDLAELARFPGLAHLSAGFADFADTAAAIASLDLLISVDTSVAHLAATLGRPTWVMLPFVPDWRWLLERADSPWYPSVRLFRQSGRGDWGEVVQRVRVALEGLCARHAASIALRSEPEPAKLRR